MRYQEIKIYTTQDGIDPLTCILMDMGIAGFTIEDAGDFQDLMNKKNSYDWDYVDDSLLELADIETNITFYLEDCSTSKLLIEELQVKLNELKSAQENPVDSGNMKYPQLGTLRLVSKTVNDEDWKDKWKEYFKPARVTDRIVIKPTWEEYLRRDDELVIELDPGMAFGTGTHPTTSLCIRLLEKYIEPEKDKVLDVGCGSGILSIAAAILGAEEVLAVDIDPVAVEVSKENIAFNGLNTKIEVKEGDLTKGLNVKADLVVANLMADLIMFLSKDIANHLKGKSIYISSGILIEKQKQVADAIRECGFEILEILEEGEWCAIAARL